MNNYDFEIAALKKIPDNIKKNIVSRNLINEAVNLAEYSTPMEELFDIYETYIDGKTAENDDWSCFKCRQKVLIYFNNVAQYLYDHYGNT